MGNREQEEEQQPLSKETILERLIWVQYEDLWWPGVLYQSYAELQQHMYPQFNSYVVKAQFALSIMRQMQEKRHVQVARLLGRPTLEIIEVDEEDYREFYWHVPSFLPIACDINKYTGKLDLFVDIHRALDEIEHIFRDATNSSMGLPMGEYKSWFDRAKAKLEGHDVLSKAERRAANKHEERSVNSLLEFGQSMIHPKQKKNDKKNIIQESMKESEEKDIPPSIDAKCSTTKAQPPRHTSASSVSSGTPSINSLPTRTNGLKKEEIRGKSGLKLPSLVYKQKQFGKKVQGNDDKKRNQKECEPQQSESINDVKDQRLSDRSSFSSKFRSVQVPINTSSNIHGMKEGSDRSVTSAMNRLDLQHGPQKANVQTNLFNQQRLNVRHRPKMRGNNDNDVHTLEPPSIITAYSSASTEPINNYSRRTDSDTISHRRGGTKGVKLHMSMLHKIQEEVEKPADPIPKPSHSKTLSASAFIAASRFPRSRDRTLSHAVPDSATCLGCRSPPASHNDVTSLLREAEQSYDFREPISPIIRRQGSSSTGFRQPDSEGEKISLTNGR